MTSLINITGFLRDRTDIQVDVLFMDRYGALLHDAEAVANVLPEDANLQAFTMRRDKMRTMKRYDLMARRSLLAILQRLSMSTPELAYEIAARRYNDRYDCVIAYQESIATSFVRHIRAKKKIAWVHNDYENVKRICGGADKLRALYDGFDKVVCVSKVGMHNFLRFSGLPEERITYIYNTLPLEVIRGKAEQPLPEQGGVKEALTKPCFKIVSSGRFSAQKRFDRVVETAARMKQQGLDFVWLILGQGELYPRLKNEVVQRQLEQQVILPGALTNPFPVIKGCDLFVLTSDFEAHPMVANEALILGVPVISTNYESACEVIQHGVNGLITGMEVDSIEQTVSSMVKDKAAYQELKNNTVQTVYHNDVIVDQVYDLIMEKEASGR